jgi:hypothetical protein
VVAVYTLNQAAATQHSQPAFKSRAVFASLRRRHVQAVPRYLTIRRCRNDVGESLQPAYLPDCNAGPACIALLKGICCFDDAPPSNQPFNSRVPPCIRRVAIGHANPTTTLRWYARWLPTDAACYVDFFDEVSERDRHQIGTTEEFPELLEESTFDLTGAPSETRTPDPLIKSQLLYQLS